MNVHLAVPDLFWPEPEAATAYENLKLPGLEALLAKGRRTTRSPLALEDWLLRAFGVEGEASAPFALLGDGGDPADAVWLHADPIHVEVTRDRLLVADATTFEIERAEADALADALNRHFASDGVTVVAQAPERWYLRLDAMPDASMVPLPRVRGRTVEGHLPTGRDGTKWSAFLNEAQMLLFSHPVNEAREARGAPAVNSVWLWGGGRLERPATRPFARVRSRDPLGAGLARAAGSAVFPLPDRAEQWLRGAEASGVELVVLDDLRAPASYGDLGAWHERLRAFDRDWFAPLVDALKAGRIGVVTLHAVSENGALDAETTRQDLRCFWRRPQPLEAYAP
jgi:hypothetical protein